MSLDVGTIQLESVTCPCGATVAPKHVFRTPTRQYVRCPACSLIFLTPRPSGAYVQQFYRDDYDGLFGQAEGGHDRLPVFDSALRHLSDYRRAPGRLLDFGCGDGAFLLLCRSQGWTCFGVEISVKAVERAVQRGFTIFPQLPAGHTINGTGQPERYDVVTLVNVLESLLNPVAVLQKVRATLAPEGIVLVRVLNGAFHLSVRRPVAWLGVSHQQAFHFFIYTPAALRHLLQTVGFHVLSIRNSSPSLAPQTPSDSLTRLGWQMGGRALRMLADGAYYLTGGHAVWAPSFEMIAQVREEKT